MWRTGCLYLNTHPLSAQAISPSPALATVNNLGIKAGPAPTVIGLYGISGSGKSFLLN